MRPSFKHLNKGDKLSAREYNRLVDLVSGLASSQYTQSHYSSTGFHTRRFPFDNLASAKIFAVQNATAGADGIYDCREQKLVDAEWNDVAGDPKFADKNTLDIEVLNLDEYNPPLTYVAHLVAGDLIAAWKDKSSGTTRWIGIPVGGMRTCSVKIQVGGVPSNAVGPFVCKLLDQTGLEVGAAIDVWPRTHLGTNDFDDDVWPILIAGDILPAYKNWDGYWYFPFPFDDTVTCEGNQITITASSDTTDVDGVTSILVDTTGGDVILGGLVGGIAGQILIICYIDDYVNSLFIEHLEGIGAPTQDFVCHTEADEEITAGGITFLCNGTKWYDCGHARHV